MANPLPENLVRQIVREWLNSKELMFNGLVETLVDRLTPVAAEQARLLIMCSISEDPRDQMLNRLLELVADVQELHGAMLKEDESILVHLSWFTRLLTLTKRSSILEDWVRGRRLEIGSKTSPSDRDLPY